MAGVAEMGKSHTINKENLFKNRGGNRGGTDRGGPRPPEPFLCSTLAFLSVRRRSVACDAWRVD